jgi:hypothetical protein
MNIVVLVEKIRSGAILSQEEREHLLLVLDKELRDMKERDPRAYLDVLNLLMDAVKRASNQLATLAS